jgi:hypothetical protein
MSDTPTREPCSAKHWEPGLGPCLGGDCVHNAPTREQVRRIINIDAKGEWLTEKEVEDLLVVARLWLAGPQVDEAMIERGIKGARDTAFWADVEVEDGLQTEADWWGNIVRGVLRAALEVTDEGPPRTQFDEWLRQKLVDEGFKEMFDAEVAKIREVLDKPATEDDSHTHGK